MLSSWLGVKNIILSWQGVINTISSWQGVINIISAGLDGLEGGLDRVASDSDIAWQSWDCLLSKGEMWIWHHYQLFPILHTWSHHTENGLITKRKEHNVTLRWPIGWQGLINIISSCCVPHWNWKKTAWCGLHLKKKITQKNMSPWDDQQVNTGSYKYYIILLCTKLRKEKILQSAN